MTLARPLALFVAALALAACSKKAPEPPKAAAKESTTPASAEPAPRKDYKEPPEDVLRRMFFKAYPAIDEKGGLPVTVTASGQSGTIRIKLYEVHKRECRLLEATSSPPGMWECSVRLLVDYYWSHKKPKGPGEDNKRISVIQAANGDWLDCTHGDPKPDECSTRRRSKPKS